MLYLALNDAFYGQKKCLKTEKFLGDYQEQTCYANCGDIAQKSSYSSDMEVYLNSDFFYYKELIPNIISLHEKNVFFFN